MLTMWTLTTLVQKGPRNMILLVRFTKKCLLKIVRYLFHHVILVNEEATATAVYIKGSGLTTNLIPFHTVVNVDRDV